jgi:hypothetical protein
MKSIAYSFTILKKCFQASSTKKAYMKAVKFVATKVLKVDDLLINYEVESTGVVTVKVYATLDEKDVLKRHCEICRETHKLFYMSDKKQCEDCNTLAFHRRLNELSKVKKQYTKNKMGDINEKKEKNGSSV